MVGELMLEERRRDDVTDLLVDVENDLAALISSRRDVQNHAGVLHLNGVDDRGARIVRRHRRLHGDGHLIADFQVRVMIIQHYELRCGNHPHIGESLQ